MTNEPHEINWSAEEVERAKEILTETQWRCWDLWTRGFGYRRIAMVVGRRYDHVRDVVKAAERKLAKDAVVMELRRI